MRGVVFVLLCTALLSCVTEAPDGPSFIVVGAADYASNGGGAAGSAASNMTGASGSATSLGAGCPGYRDLGMPCNSTARCPGTIGECGFWMCPPGCATTSNGFSTSLNPLQNSEVVCVNGMWVEQAVPLTCANFPICTCPLPVAPIPVPEIRDASVEDAAGDADGS
ncbi:MAG TPA: hypothetical protein VHO25_03165 [Polyangiaceae bacterium]|nr:hypothetical protein [Polyangiaceae bacterium]